MLALQVAAVLVLIMMVVTLVGRHVALALPYRLAPRAICYLAPALGLAVLVLVATLVGRVIGFATVPNAVAVTTAFVGLLAFMSERKKADAAKQVAAVAVVSLVAGSPVLFCLVRYGGFDSYNDAFTHLVLGNWLQHHSFNDTIPFQAVEPYSTQVWLFQQAGFRMGAPYVLGWVQAMAGLEWSYPAYPVVLSAAAAAFSLAVVFPVSLVWRVRRVDGYLLACLPGLSLGGLAFGMTKGFLPQTFGLAMSLAFLSLSGAVMADMARRPGSLSPASVWRVALVLGGLFAAVVYCYSEVSPLVVAGTVLAAASTIAMHPASARQILRLAGVSALTGIVLLNWETWRALNVLRRQSQAVVGWPIDWSVIDYLAHALGVRGGSGDGIDWVLWSRPLGYFLLLGVLLLVLWAWRRPTRNQISITLPLLSFGGLCVVSFLYFRYFVASPFPVGIGQSWSQFKLANWIFLATAVLVAGALAKLMLRFRARPAVYILVPIIALGLAQNYAAAKPRVAAVAQQLGAGREIFRTLLQIRAGVKQAIAPGEVVYLDLRGDLHKLRQLIAYLLYDVHVISNWLHDDYIYFGLPADKREVSEALAKYVIVLTANFTPDLRSKARWSIGTLSMLPLSGARYILINSAEGGYDRETEGDRWWYWVQDRIYFELREMGDTSNIVGRRVSFEYGLSPGRELTVTIIGEHDRKELRLSGLPSARGNLDLLLPSSFGRVLSISLSADGEAAPLSAKDQRRAKFLVANLKVQTEPPR